MAEWDKSRWYLMSGLLDELLESDVVTRATRLLQLRTEDPLLADQIAELLSQHAQTQMDHFLEGSAVSLLAWRHWPAAVSAHRRQNPAPASQAFQHPGDQ
jgi:hypothetical protein